MRDDQVHLTDCLTQIKVCLLKMVIAGNNAVNCVRQILNPEIVNVAEFECRPCECCIDLMCHFGCKLAHAVIMEMILCVENTPLYGIVAVGCWMHPYNGEAGMCAECQFHTH